MKNFIPTSARKNKINTTKPASCLIALTKHGGQLQRSKYPETTDLIQYFAKAWTAILASLGGPTKGWFWDRFSRV